MLAVGGKSQRPCAMSARRQVHQMFLFTKPFGGFWVITKPHDFVRISDVHIILVKDDAKRLPLPIHESLALLCSSGFLRVAHHDDFSCAGIGQKNISVRGDRQPAGILEFCCEYVYMESLWDCRQKSRWRFPHFGCVAR